MGVDMGKDIGIAYQGMSGVVNRHGSDAEFLGVICDHVSMGGSLIDLCEVWGVRYSEVLKWLNDVGHVERRRGYDSAVADGVEWVKAEVVRELKGIGMVDIRRAYGENGELLPMSEMPADLARAIAGVNVKEEFDSEGNKTGEIKTVKLWDKLRALELVGKQVGMFVDRREYKHVLTLEDLVAGSMEQVIDITPKPAEAVAGSEPAVEAVDGNPDSGKPDSGNDVTNLPI